MKRINIKSLCYLIFICFVGFSCSNDSLVFRLEKDKFKTDKYERILSFDLSSDKNLTSGLIISKKTSDSLSRYTTIIPFGNKRVEDNFYLLSSWTSHSNFTLIDYSFPSSSKDGDEYLINIAPNWSDTQDEDSNIYWVIIGQERRFIYRHRLPSQSVKDRLKEFDNIEAISLSIPTNAKVINSNSLGVKTSSPDFESDFAKFFSIKKIREKDNILRYDYYVRNKTEVNELLLFILTLLSTLFIPFLEYRFLKKKTEDENSRKRKKRIITYAILIQLAILLMIGYLGYLSYQSGEGIPYMQITTIITGVLAKAIVISLKSEKS